ncbi:MAG: F0F1 ATP synthase subunit epsilon [Bacteroides sp.]|nr:F0F1 ATP synthase subunit epsilon [Bacteroides sp.]
MNSLNLTIISPERCLYEGEADRVTLPGTVGSFTILPSHAPILSSLKAGRVTYATASGERSVEIEAGFVEMSRNRVTVCVEIKNGVK